MFLLGSADQELGEAAAEAGTIFSELRATTLLARLGSVVGSTPVEPAESPAKGGARTSGLESEVAS